MGCDIHTYTEKNISGKWVIMDFSPFNCRDYGLFGFLAGVRNYSDIKPISEPRGIPKDSYFFNEYKEDYDYHSGSWLSVKELLNFDYDQIIEDKRYTVQIGQNSWDGGATCESGKGKFMTLKKFLGESFFNDLEKMGDIGAD